MLLLRRVFSDVLVLLLAWCGLQRVCQGAGSLATSTAEPGATESQAELETLDLDPAVLHRGC